MYDQDTAEYEICNAENECQPLFRSRSNTWPMPKPAGYTDSPMIDLSAIIDSRELLNTKSSIQQQQQHSFIHAARIRAKGKRSFRRNAWGTDSYADLITQAISSAQDQRLTLSQIYNWMVENVAYFKEKAESNSSAGWKNSIRHNLSLLNRFARVPNEKGKSSWWMINPEAKLGKMSRSRAVSMEAGKNERKRERARRQLEVSKKTAATSVDQSSAANELISREQSVFNSCGSSCTTAQVRLSPASAVSDNLEWMQAFKKCKQEQQLASSLAKMVTLTSCCNTNHADSVTSISNLPANLHQIETYNCDVRISDAPVCDQNQSCNGSDINQFGQFNQQSWADHQNSTVFRKALLSIQEMSENISINLKVANHKVIASESGGSSTLIRDNSMLADIDEIISREQLTN